MKKTWRKAVFVVPYSIDKKGKKEFLILKRKLHWTGWEFCKGKIEPREKKIETAVRELKEETGISVLKKDVVDHKISGRYLYPKNFEKRPDKIGQTFHLFSVNVNKTDKIKFDPLEHNEHKWLSFEKAIKKITYPNQRRCLRIVNKYITTNLFS